MVSKVNVQAVYAQTYDIYKKQMQDGQPKYTAAQLQLIGRSNLIMTAPITAGMTQANFNINVTNGNTSAWEIRLAQTDSFTCYRLGIFAYGIIGTSTGPAGTLSNRMWSYAPFQLAKSFVAIQPLWDDGNLTMILNSMQYVRNWSTSEFYEAPRTQDAPYQAITTSGTANSALLGNRDGNSGMIDVEPTLRFNGNWNNQISLNWPNAGSSFGPVTNYVYETDNADDVYVSINYVNIVMAGLLGQNLTTILG